MASVEQPARKSARGPQGRVVLAAVINGVSLDEIASSANVTPKKIEKTLRDELRKRWIAPAQDYARLQIARLEALAAQLKEKSKSGDLPAIDRLLKVLDRLDRYHGFTKLAPLADASRGEIREKLMMKLAQAARKSEGDA
jgi:hypothetical protein